MKNGVENYLYPIIIGFLFLFEQKINILLGNNSFGAIIFISVSSVFLLKKFEETNKKNKFFIFLFFITIYSLISISLNQYCNLEFKGSFSIIVLWLLLTLLSVAPLQNFVKSNYITGIILIFLTILNIPVFLNFTDFDVFNEASHFALYILPLIAYRLISNPKDKVGLLSLAAAFALRPSSTLFVATLMILMVSFLSRSSRAIISTRSIMASVLCVAIIVMVMTDVLPMENTKYRIQGIFSSGDVREANHLNMSSLVWLNGWSQAYQSFAATAGLGLGFNQMGCGIFYDAGYYTPIIQSALYGNNLNAEDGSLLSAKLIAELGFLGVVLVVMLTWKSVASIAVLIRRRGDFDVMYLNEHVLRASGAVCMIVFLFIRSGPYFVMPLIIAIYLLYFVPYRIKGRNSEQLAS